ncbi:MAG: DUF3656 domain-containing protein, partial [Peptococcaceae bacterium]|nr:DUF3656 domain-containing protein [Peptococcaceae bacterium]
MKIPELLAPAGGMEAFRAAVENGADAVYLGGQAFNARAGAANFNLDELREALAYAHLRDVKVYVTVNIIIANAEIPELVEYLYQLYTIGIDAVIVQDLGVAYLAQHVLPELALHASTQMTVLNTPGVRLMQDLGFERVVLARETELNDMAAIFKTTEAELEVFIHGALCISYSGQCLLSSMIGGRSGNRGRCAQPCRMSYQLVDLKRNSGIPGIEVGEHLLSPKDLNLLDQLADLTQAGVASLKIEGRMKRPEYVATVVRNYRQALTRLGSGETGTPEEHRELAQIFNREFTIGHLRGNQAAELMSYHRPNNRGVMLGRIQQYDKGKGQVQLKLESELSVGDGIEVWVNKGREGAYVQHIWVEGRETESASPGQLVWIDFPCLVGTGNRVFKTHDERLMQKARLSYQEGKSTRKMTLSFHVEGKLNQPLKVIATDNSGNRGIGLTHAKLETAMKRPLNDEYLARQLDRLGNTPYTLGEITTDLSGELIVPVSEINEARRQAVEGVMAAKLDERPILSRQALDERWNKLNSHTKQAKQTGARSKVSLSVSVGDFASVEKAVAAGADIIYFGGDQFRSKQAMGRKELVQAVNLCQRNNITPVVQLPKIVAEHNLPYLHRYIETLTNLGCGHVQAADLGGLALIRKYNYVIHADYNLNIFNDISLRALAELGVRCATLSPELSLPQLNQFKLHHNPVTELIVHGTLPLMLSEYCAMGAVLGGGKRDGCSQPCKQQQFGLKDRMNFTFPLESDQHCRLCNNTSHDSHTPPNRACRLSSGGGPILPGSWW